MRSSGRFGVAAMGGMLLFASLWSAPGETPAEIGARLKAAAERDSLANADARPWHLKLNVTLFDDDGKAQGVGTIETWKAGENRRIMYEFDGKRYTRLELGGTNYRPVADVDVPYRAIQVLETALTMGPSASEVDHSTPELRKQRLGNASFDCIMLSQPSASRSHTFQLPLGMFPTYCLDPGTDSIQFSYNYGGEIVDFKARGKFLEHEVPTKFQILEGKTVVADVSLSALSTFTPKPEDFTPTEDLKPGDYYARISSGVVQGIKIGGPAPIYPESAKQAHISGSVVMRAIIGKDGHVYALQPKSSADPDLTLAAMAAVRKWTYKPYLLNGEPTEIDTTIVVNFNLSPY